MDFERIAAGRALPCGLAAACALLVSLPAAVGTAPASAAKAPAGDAMWVWYVSASGGSGEAIARKAKRRGLDAVFVKSGDGGSYWSQFSRGLVTALHRRGIDACGWHFVYGASPGREARVSARAAKAGADCVLIDAEAAYEGRYAAADKYVRKLRRRVGGGYPLGLSSFPYVDYHPAFPYSVFLGRGGAQWNLPQIYWKAIGDSVPAAFAHTYRNNLPYDRPILPVGQTWQNPEKRELRDFRRYAREYGARGVSWWSWQETGSGEWRRITGKVGRRVRGFGGGREIVNLDRGDRGDLVVLTQSLLRAAKLKLEVSGRYRRSTERAVERFQAREEIRPTGRIGDRTWRRLLERRPVRIKWSKRGRPSAAAAGLGQAAPESSALPPLAVEIPAPEERDR